LFLAIYVHVTPYREIALIRHGNSAAAASLSETLVCSLAHSRWEAES
jgi:putative membrane protein